MSLTGEARVTENEGPRCRQCRRSEARCAYLGSCCPACSHFRHLDANGEEWAPDPVVVVTRQDWQRAQWRRRYRQRQAS